MRVLPDAPHFGQPAAMGHQAEWTGWVVGELRFAPRTVDRWKACAMEPSRHADWPAWITPGPAGHASVAAELAAIDALARERERAPVAPADLVSLIWEPSRLRLKAHLSPVMFDLWGGQLAALARSAEQVGAQGEVLFLERPAHQGHRLRLDGKGPGRFDPIDTATLERWGDRLEEMAASLPPDAPPAVQGPAAPLGELHRALGGVFRRHADWALPDHYRDGPEAELVRLREDVAVMDACGLSVVGVRGRGAKGLLVEGQARALGKAWRGRAMWEELRDATSGGLVDRVLGWKRGAQGTLLIGSPRRALHLQGFLARRAASTVEVWDASAPWAGVVFAGPGAAELLGGRGGKAVTRLRPGRVRVPAPPAWSGSALIHAPLAGHDVWMLVTDRATAADVLRTHADKLCGAVAWRCLHEAAGEVPAAGPPRRAVTG
jgi:hypothetical protein